MRILRTIILAVLALLSFAFLIGFAKEIQQLRPVRPDPGLFVIFEPAIVAYYDYETAHGFQFSPFFPPAMDLPLDSVQVFRVPCWLVALLSLCILVRIGFGFVRRQWPNRFRQPPLRLQF